MRSFNGGLHMQTNFTCLMLSVALLAVKYGTIPVLVAFTLYIVNAIMILSLEPVNHPNREVDTHDNLAFIKRTYFTTPVSFLLALFFVFTQNTRYMFPSDNHIYLYIYYFPYGTPYQKKP